MTPSTYYPYRHGQLCCESVPLTKIADAVGTPAYVYSKAALLDTYRAYDHAFKDVPHLICYSIKANSNLAVIATLARAGAGADIVSGGELHRALRAGVSPKKIIFSGVGKTRDEMRDALKAEILLFNVESMSELRALDEVARELGTRAPVALRVNPDVDPQTHKYIATGLKSAKFGIPHTQAVAAYEEAARLHGIQVVGADPRRVRDGAAARAQRARRDRAAGARALDRRQRRCAAHARALLQADRRQDVRRRRRGDERSRAAGLLRLVSRHRAGRGGARRRAGGNRRRRRTDLRVRRLLREGSRAAAAGRGRPARHPERRRLRFRHGIQLQHET